MPSSKNGGNIKFGIDFEANQASLNKLKKSLQDLQKVKPTNFLGTEQQLKRIQKEISQVEKALNKAFNPTLNTTNLNTFYNELSKSGIQINKLSKDMAQLGPQGSSAFSRMATEVLTTNLQLKQTHSLIDSMGRTMINTVKWGIASSVMNTFTQSVQGAFQYVQSLEKSLTNIRIVTGDSTEKMAQFAEQANKSAQALGRSTLDYTKASLTYYQQGLNDEDVQTRTEATLKAQNITGAGSQMADYLTSVWNGYKVANEEAELYVDKLAAVADSSASDMSQLAIAMSKVASTANTMGVDIDQLNAQIATVVATTRQAPESVGTAFKTIYTRMNDIKTGAEDAEVSLGRYSGTMASLGFNVLDATGHLRDTGQVMEEIGGRWQTLTKEQQIYLAQTMGGQRQVNQLMALFDNWTTYSELLNTSLESEGTLAEKNSRYMESLGAKMEQFGAAGERVKDALINENELKGGVQALTNLVNLMGNFIESIGGGSNALLTFGSIILNMFSGPIAKELNNIVVNFQNIHERAAQLDQDFLNVQKFTEALGKGLGSQSQNDIVSNLLNRKNEIKDYYSLMSNEQINLYNNLVKEEAEHLIIQKELEEKKDGILKIEEAIRQVNESTDEAGKKLREAFNADNLQTTLGEASANIKDLFYDEIRTLKTSETGGIDELKTKFNQLLNMDEPTKFLLQNSAGFDKLQQSFNNSNISVKDLRENILTFYSQTLEGIQNLDPAIRQSIIDNLKMAQFEAENCQKKVEEFQKSIQQLSSIRTYTEMVAGLGQIASGVRNVVNLTKIWKNENLSLGQKILQTFTNVSMTFGMLSNGITKVSKGFGLIQKGIQAYAYAMNYAKGEGVTFAAAQIAAQKGLQAEYVATGAKAWLSLGPYAAVVIGIVAAIGLVVAAYKEWNKEIEAAERASKNAAEAKKHYEDLKTSLDNVKTSLDNLHTAEDNLNNLTKGTQEWRDALQQVNNQILDLIAEYPELAQYVENNNGQLSISKKGEEEYLKNLQEGVQTARNSSYVASSNSRQADARAAAAAIGHKSIYSYDDQGGATYASADQVLKVTQSIDKIIGEGASLENGLSGLTKEISDQTGISEEIVGVILQNEDAIYQLKAQLEQNATTDKLMYETMAQSKLEDNSTYQGMSDLGKQIANNLGGQALDSEIETKTNELLQQYRGIARWDNNNTVVTDMLNKLNQIQGTQWTLDSNAVRGGGEGRTFHFLNGDEQISLNAKNVAQMIATAQALEKLGTSAENTSNILSTINKSNESEGAKTGVQQFLAGDNINLRESELEDLSGETLQNIFGDNIDQVAKDAGYESATAFKQAFEENINGSREEFASIGENAFGPVKQQLDKSLSDGDYLLNTQKNLEAIFSNIFKQSGSDAMKSFENIKDILMETKDLSQEEKESLLSLFANADLSTPKGLNELEESLRQLGAQTILASEDWAKFKGEIQNSQFVNPVDTIFDQQATIDSITGDLKKGSVINEEDLQTLAALDSGVRDFFKRTAEGYELIGNKGSLLKLLAGSNPDYLEAANNLDSLITKAEELKNIVGENLNVENLKDTELQNYTSSLMDSLGGNKEAYAALGTNQEYIQTAKKELRDLMAIETDERDEEWQAEYDERIAILKEFVSNAQQLPDTIHRSTEELRSAAALNANTLSELNSMLMEREKDPEGKAGISGQQFGAALQSVSKREMEDLGFDPEVYENYVDLLQATNEKYAENEYLARQVANANMRISQGTQDLIDNWKDWNKVFQDYLASDRDVGVLAEKWGQFKDTLANLFDMDAESFDLLGPNFVADNLDKIEAVKDGIPGAYEDLESLIEDELWGRLEDAVENSGRELKITAGMDINKGEIYTTSQQLFNQLQAISDNANIEVGTNVDDTNLIAGLNNMIDASNMASDEMAAIFDAMGYDVEFQEKPDAIHQKSENVEYYVPPTYKMQDLGNSSLGFAGLSLPVSVPVIDQPGHYDSTKGEKETYEPGTYAIKTITKNGKGSGGKISRKTAGAPSNKGSGGKGGGGKGGKGGGGGKAKEPNKAKGATNKADRYRNNTVKANKLANSMTKLQKQQEKLTGKDSLKNLQKQLQILKKQNDTIRERIGLQRDEQKQLANNLKKFGATFNKDGTLNNYFKVHAKIMQQYNNQVAKWNKMSAEQQQKNKDMLNNAKEVMDNALKDLQRYDKLQQEIAKSIQQQIDNAQEQIDNQVKQFELKIDASIDLSKAKRDWNKFKREVIDEVRDDDILGLNRSRFADISSFYNDNHTGSIQQITDRLKEITGEGDTTFSAQYFTQKLKKMTLTDRNSYIEEISKYSDALKDQLEELKGTVDEIRDSVFDAMNAMQDAFDQQMDQYEFIGDIIDHNMKVIELMYGDQAYDKMSKYYDKIEENNNNQLAALANQKDYWYNLMRQAEENMVSVPKDSNLYKQYDDRRKEYQKLWMDSIKDLQSATEDALDNVMDKYANTINQVLLNLELSLGNGNKFDDIEDEWDRINDQADMYLDKINSTYEIEKLANAYEDAIKDNDGDIAAQQALNDLMEQQLAYLKDKDKLTQYDVDRANTLLQIEMKRLALEQSRSNKNRLRLRRDSQGNYTYQYTADTDAINKAEQELADARVSLYNSDKAAYVDNLSSIQKSAENIKSKLEDIWTDQNLSHEQKLKKSYELQKYYGDMINNLLADNASIRNNLIDSAFEDIEKTFGINREVFNQLSKEEQDKYLSMYIPQINSTTAQLVDQLFGTGGIGGLIQEFINEAAQVDQDKVDSIAKVQEQSRTVLEDVVKGTDVLLGQSEKLLENNQERLDIQKEILEGSLKQLQTAQQVLQKYQSQKQAAIELLETIQQIKNEDYFGLLGTTKEQNAAYAQAQMDLLDENMKKDIVGDFTPPRSSSDWASIYGSSSVDIKDLYKSKWLDSVAELDDSKLNSIQKNIESDSIQDSVEQLLNKYNTMRNDSINVLNESLFNSINNTLNNILETSQEYYAKSLINQQAIEKAIIANQTIHIDADFPNAKDISNILQAIDTLTAVAAQKAGTVQGKSSGSKKK